MYILLFLKLFKMDGEEISSSSQMNYDVDVRHDSGKGKYYYGEESLRLCVQLRELFDSPADSSTSSKTIKTNTSFPLESSGEILEQKKDYFKDYQTNNSQRIFNKEMRLKIGQIFEIELSLVDEYNNQVRCIGEKKFEDEENELKYLLPIQIDAVKIFPRKQSYNIDIQGSNSKNDVNTKNNDNELIYTSNYDEIGREALYKTLDNDFEEGTHSSSSQYNNFGIKLLNRNLDLSPLYSLGKQNHFNVRNVNSKIISGKGTSDSSSTFCHNNESKYNSIFPSIFYLDKRCKSTKFKAVIEFTNETNNLLNENTQKKSSNTIDIAKERSPLDYQQTVIYEDCLVRLFVHPLHASSLSNEGDSFPEGKTFDPQTSFVCPSTSVASLKYSSAHELFFRSRDELILAVLSNEIQIVQNDDTTESKDSEGFASKLEHENAQLNKSAFGTDEEENGDRAKSGPVLHMKDNNLNEFRGDNIRIFPIPYYKRRPYGKYSLNESINKKVSLDEEVVIKKSTIASHSRLHYDYLFAIESYALGGFFGIVWDSSLYLTTFLAQISESFFLEKNILELGAATALPSLLTYSKIQHARNNQAKTRSGKIERGRQLEKDYQVDSKGTEKTYQGAFYVIATDEFKMLPLTEKCKNLHLQVLSGGDQIANRKKSLINSLSPGEYDEERSHENGCANEIIYSIEELVWGKDNFPYDGIENGSDWEGETSCQEQADLVEGQTKLEYVMKTFGSFDILLLSDLIYDPSFWNDLIETILICLGDNSNSKYKKRRKTKVTPMAIICSRKRNIMEQEFYSLCKENGLNVSPSLNTLNAFGKDEKNSFDIRKYFPSIFLNDLVLLKEKTTIGWDCELRIITLPDE